MIIFVLFVVLSLLFIAISVFDGFEHYRICYQCGKVRFNIMLEYLGVCWFCKVKKLWDRISCAEVYCRKCEFETNSVWKAIAHTFAHPSHEIADKW